MSSIFISHNYKDKEFVRDLSKRLQMYSIQTWVDEAELKIGDSLIEKIGNAIESVDYLGVVLSNNSINSIWVQKEVEIALNKEIYNKKVFVLPILLENCKLPAFLNGRVYADFSKKELFDDSTIKLAEKLGGLKPTPPELSNDKKFNIPFFVFDGESESIYKHLGYLKSNQDSKFVNMIYFSKKHVIIDLIIPGVAVGAYNFEKNFNELNFKYGYYSESLAWIEVTFERSNKSVIEVEDICIEIVKIHNDELRFILYFSENK